MTDMSKIFANKIISPTLLALPLQLFICYAYLNILIKVEDSHLPKVQLLLSNNKISTFLFDPNFLIPKCAKRNG